MRFNKSLQQKTNGMVRQFKTFPSYVYAHSWPFCNQSSHILHFCRFKHLRKQDFGKHKCTFLQITRYFVWVTASKKPYILVTTSIPFNVALFPQMGSFYIGKQFNFVETEMQTAETTKPWSIVEDHSRWYIFLLIGKAKKATFLKHFHSIGAILDLSIIKSFLAEMYLSSYFSFVLKDSGGTMQNMVRKFSFF